MKSSTDYKPAENLAILLVGNPKTGKTCVAASFPKPYFLDVDNNLDSAARLLAGKQFWYDQPAKGVKPEEVWKISLNCLKDAVANPEIQTIVLDSLSMLADYACAWIIAEHARLGDKDKNGKLVEALTIPDYGKLLQMFKQLVFSLRLSNKYIIVTSHQSNSKDELTGAVHYALAIPGQAKDTLGGAFTDVWATMASPVAGGKTKYEIRTRPTGFHVALGTSIRTFDAAIDITDKTPDQVWSTLAPKLGIK